MRGAAPAVIVAVALLVIAEFLGMRPSWPGLILLVFCVAALSKLWSAAVDGTTYVRWETDEQSGTSSRGDGRLVQLGHVVRSASTALPDGSARPSAAALQRRLAVVAHERAGDRPLPPDLSSYLAGDPVVMDSRRLDRLLKEIEDL